MGGRSGQAVSRGSSAAVKTAVSVEAEIRKQRAFETGVIIDVNGDILLRKDGEARSVSFTPLETSLMKNNVFTHNHPLANHSFSTADVSIFVAHGLKEMRAVARKNTYSLKWKEGVKKPHWKQVKRWHRAAHNKVQIRNMVKINAGTMTIHQAESNHWHDVMVTMIAAHDFFIYKKI